MESQEGAKEKSTAAVLQEQIALIAILVVLVGTVYSDSYYAAFGLRYQSLNLPAAHIIYRGFTVLVTSPYVAIPPYLLAVGWLALISTRRPTPWIGQNQIWLTYVVIVGVLFLAYPLTVHAGLRAAAQDRGMESHLPRIKQMLSAHAAAGPRDKDV